MDQISILAAAGMQARMQSLDIVANNIANSSTGGYKGDSEFYTVFTSEAANEDGQDAPTTLPMIQKHWTDFSQGVLEPTNNPLDLGLEGNGFFVVEGPSGPLYTRHGNFRVSTNGTLVTADGYPLLDRGGQSFKLALNQPLEVSPDGILRQNGPSLGADTTGRLSRSRSRQQAGPQLLSERQRTAAFGRHRLAGFAGQGGSFQRERVARRYAAGLIDAAVRDDAKGHFHLQ
jgi:flagellar hook-basal body protein